MENFSNLTKTEQITKSAKTIEEKLLQLLKDNNASSKFVEKQTKINANVDKFVSSLGNIDNVDDKTYLKYLLRFCALFKNAHLTLSYTKSISSEWNKYLSQRLICFNDKIYVCRNNKFFEVEKIGNLEVSKLIKMLSKYISFETKEWFNFCLNIRLNYSALPIILDIDFNKITLKNGEVLTCNLVDDFFDFDACFSPFKSKSEPYEFEILLSDILKIDYMACYEKNEGDFLKFVEKVKAKIEEENISTFILDIRGNTGGNSEIIWPLINLFEDKKMKGVTLVDNRVFSSGTFAAYYAKKVLGTPLIGQNLAQENIRFGQSSGTVCLAENLLIRYTEKFFDFSDVFKESGAIKPDIEVPLYIEDLENKKDLTLEVAKEYLKSNFMKKTKQCNTK